MEARVAARTLELCEANASLRKEIAERDRAEESVRLSAEIIDHMDQGVQLARTDTRKIVFANPRFEQMFGYGPGELLGKPVTFLTASSEQSPEETAGKIIRSLNRTGTWSGEIRNVRKDGTTFWCRAVVSTFEHTRYGTVWVSVHQDITERKSVRDDLRKSEQRYRGLFDQAPLSIWEEDFTAVGRWADQLRASGVEDLGEYLETHPDAVLHAVGLVRVIAVNQGTVELFEAENKERLLQPSAPWVQAESVQGYSNEAFVKQLKAIWDGVGKVESEFSMTTFKGARIDCLFRWVAPGANGRLDLSRVIVAITDITERKQAERRQQEAENRYRTLFDQLPDAVVLTDPDTTLPIEFNHLAPRLLGYSPEEFATLRVADYDANESPEQFREHVERVLRDGGDEFETKMRTKDGSILDVVVRVRVAEISGRKVFHSIFRDITERRKTEEEIRRLATALEAAGEAALITDTQGIIEYVNPAFETLYGFTRAQALGKTPRILKSGQHDAAFYEQLWATIAARRVWRSEIINRCGDGTLIEVEETIAPVCSPSGELTGYVSLARDVSERKEAEQRARSQEAEMARMARMSTLGELATGIAHEVNQPLAAIVNFTGAALQRARAGDVQSDELCHTLEQTAEMAERAGQIIHRIRDLVRKDDPRRSATDLNELLRESLALLSGRIRAGDVSLVLELTENLPPVSVDAIQIQQVILNLVHNAVEALGQPGLKKHQVILQTQRSQGGAEVIVKDTGPGIDPAVADRLFEPFVTTKGEGLGMGLPISASIIRAHNGRLWHVHEDGGAAFHFTLPSV